jgi:hypothetical protein
MATGQPGGYNRDPNGRNDPSMRPHSVRDQITWLNDRVRAAALRGSITQYGADRLMRDLRMIDNRERSMPHFHGTLSTGDEASIRERLDGVNSRLADARDEHAR